MSRRLTVAVVCGVFALPAVSAGTVAAGQGSTNAKGRTAQGNAIRLVVHPRSVQVKSFSIKLRCSGGYVLVDQESGFLPSPVNGKGLIRDRQFGSTDEVAIRGRVGAQVVRGKLRVHDRLGKHRCASKWVKFTAHR